MVYDVFLSYIKLLLYVSKYLCSEDNINSNLVNISNHGYAGNSAIGQQASNNKGANI